MTNPFEQKEKTDEEIIAANTKKIEIEGMRLLSQESMGGNAGSTLIEGRHMFCAGLNGSADPQTGEIFVFSNYADRKDIKGRGFLLRVAIALPLSGFRYYGEKIIEIHGISGFTKRAQHNLEQSAKRFNQIHFKQS